MSDAAASVMDECEPCFTLSATISGIRETAEGSPALSFGCLPDGFAAGQSRRLVASPARGWQVGSLAGTNGDLGISASNNAVMPTGDHIVGVKYVRGQYSGRLYSPSLRR